MKTIQSNILKGISILALLGMFAAAASAQFTINIPKIPKIKKPQPKQEQPAPTTEQTRPTTTEVSTQTAAEPAEQPKEPCKGDAVLNVHLEDLEKTRKEAESFTPARDYYVSTLSDRRNIYLNAAISPSKRKDWLGDWPKDFVDCMNPALDGLAEVAKRTLPNYKLTGYNVKNPAEEKILRSGVTDISEATVFKVGLLSAAWKIAKDDYNFPTARYKHGALWAKYPKLDDGYCRIIYVNIVQDYAGGGTYGDSYANFIRSEPAGCPAGK